MRKLLQVLLFLMFVDEGNALYKDHMPAPFAWVHPLLFEPIAHVRPFDVFLALVLLFSSRGKRNRTPMVRPMRRTLLIAALVTLGGFVHGVGMGGDARAASWQVYLLFANILAAFAFAAVFHTAEDFLELMKAVVGAALYRAVMCLVFYFYYLKQGVMHPFPEYVTTHEDTVLWTVGVGFFALWTIETPKPRNIVLGVAAMLLLLIAIQLNRRRLAWITLAGVLATIYVIIPPSVAKKRVRRFALTVAPILTIYAVVGWGRPEGIFKPLLAFQTTSSSGEDASTKARNAENLGLIATSEASNFLLGPGWGHRYVEVTSKYQIHFFELWPYVPHNGVLGLFAYTGYLGFVGYWLIFPTAAFLHARTARLAVRRADRFIGVIGFIELIACANQWYGDMGAFSAVASYMLATSLAVALRGPVGASMASEPAARSSEALVRTRV